MKKKQAFLAINIDDEMNHRIQSVATKLKLKKNALARLAIEAAVESIESTGTLMLPVKFTCLTDWGLNELPRAVEEPPVYGAAEAQSVQKHRRKSSSVTGDNKKNLNQKN